MPVTDPLDKVLEAADGALRALFARPPPARPLPLPAAADLPEADRRHAAGLMRVNHAGEIAAQGLYQGQLALSRNPATAGFLRRAALEEGDHLAWCETRLGELASRTSLLNPLWYLGSFLVGAAAAAIGDQWSLGFVVETERQVEGHLASHLQQLPAADTRSRAIVEQMQRDEIGHGAAATALGAAALPAPVPALMRTTARLLTRTAYWL